MGMVQEQQLQLKMKFLLSYNMNMVVLYGENNLVGASFLVEEDYPRLVLIIEI